jgi:hypothetical protein
MEAETVGKTANSITGRMILRILGKTLVLLVCINLLYLLLNPLPWIGRLSIYNSIVPGRERLPYGDDPSRSFNLSLTQMDAMFASHIISSTQEPADEYRVLLIGDSATWGYLLPPDQTLAEQLNSLQLTSRDGRKVHVFNLGYPTMSATKDLMFLERSLAYDPDLIIWLFTLESMPWTKQLDSPILTLNPEATLDLMRANDLPIPASKLKASQDNLWGQTIFGQKRELADWARLQIYGLLWAATSVDHEIPATYNQRMEDLPADPNFQGYGPGELEEPDLAFDVLRASLDAANGVPILFVNEPMFISQGLNSDLRYNFYYPRWAYDRYRELLAENAQTAGWRFVDLWDMLPASVFTDSAIHYSAEGARLLALDLAIYISGQ